MRIGADSGGTFTDVVSDDGRILKVPSTPAAPGAAVRSGIEALNPAGAGLPVSLLAHGTTLATNALLQRRLGRVALVVTEGFSDVIEIARQDRPSLYDQWVDRPPPLVDRADRLEVAERMGATGEVVRPYRGGSAPEIPPGVEVVAVCCLHADLNATHERTIAQELRDRGVDVVSSHQVVGEFREYERMVTTVINAALQPVCSEYLMDLSSEADDVVVMSSGGGLITLERAAELPVSLLLSGPAAGARASAAVATACGFPNSLSFDMGGTSTDVCLALDGQPAVAAQQEVAGFPIRLPSLDVHTVGAGGGSIASIDHGGALVVGPQSAGADPGPVCYGKGAQQPTVTDANYVAGRIPHGTSFPGLGELDLVGARQAMAEAGVTAEGVIQVVNATMAQALRKVSVEQGVDPTGLVLVAFGGAGPLHACDLADDLGIPVVIVPAAAGVLSAVGLLSSPPRIELVESWPTPSDLDGLDQAALRLGVAAETEFGDSAPMKVETLFDCRYSGQSHEIRVDSVADFHAEHERRNGYSRLGDTVEVTAIRAVATGEAPTSIEALSEASIGWWSGRDLAGPKVVAREDCTIWIPGGWSGTEGPLGALILERIEGSV